MPDYKELYLTMMRETEKAIRILVEAQKTCEERYLQSEETEGEEQRGRTKLKEMRKKLPAADRLRGVDFVFVYAVTARIPD